MQLKSETCLCVFSTLVAVLLRCCTTLNSYSGQGKPPMFGDYEAQRHWMEVTVNLPVDQWYKNTTDNDLMYWGLDYPPLTAYHSYVCGLVAYLLDPDYVELHTSRGFESESHKVFMRFTVLVADLCIYIPAVLCYFCLRKGGTKLAQLPQHFSLVLALFYPGIILIDHGHFQYNCISLGLTIFAVCFMRMRQYILAALLFSLSLNYKQMELYHALPFFMYLLSICVPKPGLNILSGFINLCKIGLTVVLCFIIIWVPFLFSVDDFVQVLRRLFPVARGVFEDKVANVWCALNVLFKFKVLFSNQQMLRYCFIATLVSVLPSSIDLFLRPNIKKFMPALIISSLGFFLFSYQVHEKSILLAAVPVTLYLQEKPFICFWFLNISFVSMFPLFVKDDLVIASIVLWVFYLAVFHVVWQHVMHESSFSIRFLSAYNVLRQLNRKTFFKNLEKLYTVLCFIAIVMSFSGCFLIILLMLLFQPPNIFPDIYPLLISVYACAHFIGFFIYFNIIQFKIPQAAEDVRYVKVKSD